MDQIPQTTKQTTLKIWIRERDGSVRFIDRDDRIRRLVEAVRRDRGSR